MLWRREKSEELLADAIKSLRLAHLKVRIGRRFVEDRASRQEFFREVTLTTAFMGFPVPPEFMGKLYARGALGEIRKTLRLLRRLDKKLEEEKPGIYEVQLRRPLREAVGVLEEVVS